MFTQLRERGASSAVVEFSGGNDEGGADGITLYDAEGESIKTITEYVPDTQWNPETQKWETVEVDSEVRADVALGEALVKPIYDRWGSFAGEFHVYGTAKWDVETGKVELDYQESVETYSHHSDEV